MCMYVYVYVYVCSILMYRCICVCTLNALTLSPTSFSHTSISPLTPSHHHTITVSLYSCPNLGTNCAQCLSIDRKYNCSFCDSSTGQAASCNLDRVCNEGSATFSYNSSSEFGRCGKPNITDVCVCVCVCARACEFESSKSLRDFPLHLSIMSSSSPPQWVPLMEVQWSPSMATTWEPAYKTSNQS